VLVNVTEPGVAMPVADAATLYEPPVPLAVADTEATPSAPITAVPEDNVADAPESGLVNVKTPPSTGSL
jgi:hypothetical protein